MLSKNVNNKKCAPELILDIDFESQILALFDSFPLSTYVNFKNLSNIVSLS